MTDPTGRAIECPWCFKRFATLSGRRYHAVASHVGKDLDLVAYDIVDGIQMPRTPRSNRMQPIGEIVAPIVSRVTSRPDH